MQRLFVETLSPKQFFEMFLKLGLKIRRIITILLSSGEEGKYRFTPFGECRHVSLFSKTAKMMNFYNFNLKIK